MSNSLDLSSLAHTFKKWTIPTINTSNHLDSMESPTHKHTMAAHFLYVVWSSVNPMEMSVTKRKVLWLITQKCKETGEYYKNTLY